MLECESDKREFNYPYIPFARIDETGSIKIDIQAPETLTCSWFNIPTSDDEKPTDDSNSGQTVPESDGVPVTITVLTCAGIPNVSACDPAEAGLGVSLKSV